MDKFNDNEQDEFDLSKMIDEYESDNGLRDKIEALKKEKQLEEMKKHEEAADEQKVVDELKLHSALYVDPSPKSEKDIENTAEHAAMNIIDADVDKTMIAGPNINDVDKTLVIMDNQKQKSYGIQMDEQEDASLEDIDEERPEEYIDVEDLEDFIPKDKEKKSRWKDFDKKNKMIAYICIGIATVCVIGLCVFAWNIFVPGDDTEKKDTDKTTETDKDKDKDKDTNKDNPTTNTPDNNQTNNQPDNSVEIAEINGQIDVYTRNLNDANANRATQVGIRDATKPSLDTALTRKTNAEASFKDAEKAYNANKSDKNLEEAYKRAQTEKESAQTNYDSLYNQYNDALGKITSYENEISEYQKNIDDLKYQLSQLQ